MKLLLATLIKNLVGMLVTETMILWALEAAAKYTDNKIDDNIILIVKGAYASDLVLVKQGIEGLLAKLKSESNHE